jgi:hypothetical protein
LVGHLDGQVASLAVGQDEKAISQPGAEVGVGDVTVAALLPGKARFLVPSLALFQASLHGFEELVNRLLDGVRVEVGVLLLASLSPLLLGGEDKGGVESVLLSCFGVPGDEIVPQASGLLAGGGEGGPGLGGGWEPGDLEGAVRHGEGR